jgi:hypothetical protein
MLEMGIIVVVAVEGSMTALIVVVSPGVKKKRVDINTSCNNNRTIHI